MTTQTLKAKLKDPLIHVTADFLKDPYPYYKELRETDPIFWSEDGKYWLVTKYAHADLILRDMRFGKRNTFLGTGGGVAKQAVRCLVGAAFPVATAANSMLIQNPPDHTRLRGLVNKAFTPKMVEQMRSHIQEIADELLNKVQNKGKMDAVADFAFPLPVTVIAEMLGIPSADRQKFKRWSNSMVALLEPGARMVVLPGALAARSALIAYLRPLIEQRRKKPQEDLISSLVQAEEEGSKLTEAELLANIVLLLIAGHETTVNLISNSILGLLTNPSQMQLLKSKPELMRGAVEEFLRWSSPVQIVRRFAMEDVVLDGKTIKNGESVVVCVAAANRDPEEFPNPDKLDVARSNIKHLAFGVGIHHCLGFALAETEGEISVGTLLRRMPDLQLAMDPSNVEYKRPIALRGPKRLPITF
jgi:cytochrome P450